MKRLRFAGLCWLLSASLILLASCAPPPSDLVVYSARTESLIKPLFDRYTQETGQKIQLISQPKWLNTWLIEKFCRWLDGGPEMETNVEANLHAAALIFAGIESQRQGAVMRIADYVGSHG